LKIGSSDDSKHADDIEHGRAGLLAVLWGSIVSAAFALIIETQIFASDVVQNFRIGKKGAVSGYDFSLSFLLLGIGHLVGLSVGIAMLIGLLIGWGRVGSVLTFNTRSKSLYSRRRLETCVHDPIRK
jgi:uncharacterized oligopeptide transporter (OPT) family protein